MFKMAIMQTILQYLRLADHIQVLWYIQWTFQRKQPWNTELQLPVFQDNKKYRNQIFWCDIFFAKYISQVSQVSQVSWRENSNTLSEIYDIFLQVLQVSQVSHVFITF